MIELKHVQKVFEEATPLKDVNCIINNGDVISIIGPSGTGKSTLLRCINMLDAPTSGDIFVDGECITAKGYDVTKARKKIGMVFQSFNLFSHLTIIENIMKPQMELLGRDKKTAYKKAMELLRKVGLASRVGQYPDQLSGGQKQRVAICRTVAMDPQIILFDEPTSALDPTMIGEVQAVIRDLAESGTTMMIVTHEMQFARSICNRVFYMDEGGIYEDGSPQEIFENPKKEKTKVFINQLKTLSFDIKIDYDFQATEYKIEEYGRKNLLENSLVRKISSSFEELCSQIILPYVGKDIQMKVEIIHSAKTQETKLIALYNGNNFDPLNSKNEIALKLLKSSIKAINHESISEGVFTNKVTIIY